MKPSLLERLQKRAAYRCEYCYLPMFATQADFEIDHIFALVHGGETILENLAYSCWHCNCFKGANLAGIDPDTRRVTRLFHPRKHVWKKHFEWNGAVLEGLTAIGRATIVVLRINWDFRVNQRMGLIAIGEFFE